VLLCCPHSWFSVVAEIFVALWAVVGSTVEPMKVACEHGHGSKLTSKGAGTEVPWILSQFVHNVRCKIPLRADQSPGMLAIIRCRLFFSSRRSDRYIMTRAVLWGTQIPDDEDTGGNRNVALLTTQPPDAPASPRIFYWILSSILLSNDIKIKYTQL
jgi:hypothetical protein